MVQPEAVRPVKSVRDQPDVPIGALQEDAAKNADMSHVNASPFVSMSTLNRGAPPPT